MTRSRAHHGSSVLDPSRRPDRTSGEPEHAAPHTCADWVPLDMREPTSSGAQERHRVEYLAGRRALRRLVVRGWVVVLVLWAAALAAVLLGADPDSPEGSLAQGMSYLLPIALLGVIPGWYVWRRSRTRIDDFEPTHESAAEDPYPADRFARAVSVPVLLASVMVIALMVLWMPWLAVSEHYIEAQEAALWTLAFAALVGALLMRGRRSGVVATEDGVVVTTFLRRRTVPWSAVSGFDVEVVTTTGNRGQTYRDLRLVIRAPGRLPKLSGVPLRLSTRGQRARARHNLRVAARWSLEHGKRITRGLEAGMRWADGDIPAEDLWHL